MKNKSILDKILFLIITLLFPAGGELYAQITEGDSLTLGELISLAVKDHPTVNMAAESVNNADARINLARSGYYPDISFDASYSRVAPVTELDFPGLGTFELFPSNNYSAQVNYRQMIYDFGRTRQNIKVENEGKIIDQQTVEYAKQKLSLVAVNNYFTLAYLQSAIKIKDEQLATLNEHLNHVNKLRETGSATEYQVLSTQVKISNVESQKVDLEAALSVQKSLLVSLTGNEQLASRAVKTEFTADLPLIAEDSMLSYAFRNRDEVILNEGKKAAAELRYGMIKLQNMPSLNLVANGGVKNGYVPDLNELKANYVAGVGLKIPIFDGMRRKYNLMQAKSAINSVTYEEDYTKRSVTSDLSDAQSSMMAAKRKIDQFSLQLQQAQKAYSLALTSFYSGVITNLDLLDANTAVSESRLLLLKARMDYAASVYKFKAALGERLYK
jgi:outer membrane protein TolC